MSTTPKAKHFYSHIIDIEIIHISLGNLGLSDKEKEDLINLLESSIHHAVVDTILSQLGEKEKKLFLSQLQNDQHDNIWTFLKGTIENAEEKIKEVAHNVRDRMYRDIQQLLN